MNLEQIAEAILLAMESGVADLNNPILRIDVDDSLRRAAILQNPQDFDGRALMKQFFLAIVRDWPSNSTLQYVEPKLTALRDIRTAMDFDEIDEHFAVSKGDCRIVEGRQDLEKFKQRLRELVLHEWDQSSPGEGG